MISAIITKTSEVSLNQIWSVYNDYKERKVDKLFKNFTNPLSPYWSPNYSGISEKGTLGAGVDQSTYIGQIYDTNTDLDYLNARYYKADIGRFISQDPVFLNLEGQGKEVFATFLSDPQSQNSYSYGKNNPVTFSDPDGKFVQLLPVIAVLATYAPQITSFVQSLTTPIGQYGISQAINDAHNGNYSMALIGGITAGELPQGRLTNNIVKFGEGLGSKINNTLKNVADTGFDLSDHAAYRMVQKNVTAEQVVQTVKNNNPVEYFHEGQWKLGFRDAATKVFVGQAKDSSRIITIIPNTSRNYLSNLLKRSKDALSKLKK